MTNTEKYDEQIERLFNKLEGMSHRGKEIVDEKTATRVRHCIVAACTLTAAVATTSGIVGLIEVMEGGLRHSPGLMWFMSGCGGVIPSVLGSVPLNEMTKRDMIPALGWVGKATAMTETQAWQINTWAKKYPRMLAVFARWAVDNPQNQISGSDFGRLEKKLGRIDELMNLKEKLAHNELAMTKSGLPQAVVREKLGRIAGKNKELGQGRTKPAM